MASSFLPAAEHFLNCAAAHTPDYSRCTVLVPHHHAAHAFRQALRAALAQGYFQPPRLLTLPELASGADPDLSGEPDSLRLAMLHDFLARTHQLPNEALWEAARELLALLNELDEHDIAQLDIPGARQANAYLSLEAGIARAVWQALNQNGARGPMGAYRARLMAAAAHAGHPLYTLGLVGLTQVEQGFLRLWAERQPVIPLPDPPPLAPRQALLEEAWQGGDLPLASRAVGLAARQAASPCRPGLDVLAAPGLTVLAAPGLEAAARAAEATLLGWLARGRRQIAVVALDRLLARRLRALLERRGILLQDETGWTFSTASASHVLERWLALVLRDTGLRDLLDLLKSPFVFADAGPARAQAIHALEGQFRRHGAPDDLDGYIALAQREGMDDALALLKRLRQAKGALAAGRLSMRAWTQRLLDSLAILGADAPLRADPIGGQLLALLDQLARDSAGFEVRFSLADWRQWLFLHLEQSTFADDTVDSPIRLTHLAAAHHRELEGAIVLGVGAAQLPPPGHSGFFNDAARRQLGLPDARQREQIGQGQLADLLARVPQVALVWQSAEGGEPLPLSPWLVHLDAFHRAAWGSSLITPCPPARQAFPASAPAAPAFPSATAVPQRLSVSAWQSLVSCPYQFHARHLLGLNQLDEVPEEMDKADYGSLVHQVLARFHRGHPSLAGQDRARLAADLEAISREVFAPAEARHYLALAWRQRWTRQIAGYVAWALAWEGDGHRFQAAETPLAKTLEWGPGQHTRIEGRADRIDAGCLETNAGLSVVLDYKTQARATLNAKLDPHGEDVQLATYAWLADAAQAGFITLDDKKVAALLAPGDQHAAAQAEAGRLAATLAALAEGQPLPAHGAPGTCAWCEMRGLCRRDYHDPA